MAPHRSKQRISYANKTKWRELQHCMAALGVRAPRWRIKTISGDEYPGRGGWDGDWSYHFRGNYLNHDTYEDMEWCEITPSDHSIGLAEIISLCRVIGFEIEMPGQIIRLIGYR
jgi:hypothetical protein